LNANRGVVADPFTVRGDRGQQFAFICSWIWGYKQRESVELKFTHPLAKSLLAFEKVDIRSLLATEFDLSNIENRETSGSGASHNIRLAHESNPCKESPEQPNNKQDGARGAGTS
jgi:hypothetical protein